MKAIRTVRIPIKNNEFYNQLMNTMFFYTLAYNYVCQLGFKSKITNGITLHQKSYKFVRQFLPAQLTCSARTKATETLISLKKKKSKHCPKSRKQSIRYDHNSYSLFMDSNQISLSTTDGRIKIPLEIRSYYKQYLTWKNTSAELVLDKKNRFWLHVVFEKEIADIMPDGNLVGIDRGINNLAVTSNNKFYNGKKLKEITNRYNRLRSKLQSAKDNGSRSAKRHLTKLSDKERRFRKDTNHCVSKQIINSLEPGDTIILEDLTGIRIGKRRRKRQAKIFHNWAFYQLDQFLLYKGLAKGINIEYVDARYTSQKCSECGHIEKKNRKGSEFCCKECGFQLHADLNAARNIKQLKRPGATGTLDRAAFNQPQMSPDFSSSDRSSPHL